MLKALSNLAGVRLIDEVELAILRRTAGADQFVLDPAVMRLAMRFSTTDCSYGVNSYGTLTRATRMPG
jgi:hypothetical protein